MRRNTPRSYVLIAVGLAALLAASAVACGEPEELPEPEEPAPITHISIEPDRMTLVSPAGGVELEWISIHSSADEELSWEAKDDATWLKIVPSRGSFDCGVSEVAVKVSVTGMTVGHYDATISIFVAEADNNPATARVALDITTPEDPAVAAARKFWEASVYRRYWDTRAAGDVRDAVYSYPFPDYTLGECDEVSIKECHFEYRPEEYERPIAVVRCQIRWIKPEALEGRGEESYWVTTWYSDTTITLEVAPGPFSAQHNEWEVVDWYD